MKPNDCCCTVTIHLIYLLIISQVKSDRLDLLGDAVCVQQEFPLVANHSQKLRHHTSVRYNHQSSLCPGVPYRPG